jgi:hypothetical protein
MSATVTWIEESVLRGGVVAEAARPVSYMKVGKSARVTALAERWGWKVEGNDAEQAQEAVGSQNRPAHSQGKL